jgi:hypothetical protein
VFDGDGDGIARRIVRAALSGECVCSAVCVVHFVVLCWALLCCGAHVSAVVGCGVVSWLVLFIVLLCAVVFCSGMLCCVCSAHLFCHGLSHSLVQCVVLCAAVLWQPVMCCAVSLDIGGLRVHVPLNTCNHQVLCNRKCNIQTCCKPHIPCAMCCCPESSDVHCQCPQIAAR